MPVDINEVRVEFGNGIKREEYGPTKSAKVTVTAVVNTGEDGAVVLTYISKLATAQVAALLAGTTPPTSVDVGEAAPVGEKPATRRRASSAPAAAADSTTSVSATPASTVSAAETPGQPQSSQQSDASANDETVANLEKALAPAEDEWATDTATAEITDKELTDACGATAERTGNPVGVRETIQLFNTKPAGEKFAVIEIPQAQRGTFLAKLKAL